MTRSLSVTFTDLYFIIRPEWAVHNVPSLDKRMELHVQLYKLPAESRVLVTENMNFIELFTETIPYSTLMSLNIQIHIPFQNDIQLMNKKNVSEYLELFSQ
jgi:hypothetical protein